MSPSPTEKSKSALTGLMFLGLGGTLISSSIMAGAALLIAISGIVIAMTGKLKATGWDKPRELRLIHFGFWFFVLVSAISWAFSGFSYEGFKTLGVHARFILFWPLLVALTYARVRARHLFIAFMLMAFAAGLAIVLDNGLNAQAWQTLLKHPAGYDLNPIIFGNLSLLAGFLSLAGALFYTRQQQRTMAALLIIASLIGLAGAGLSQTRSSLVALPVLALLFIPLLPRNARVPALVTCFALIALAAGFSDRVIETVTGVAAGSFDQSIELRFAAWGEALRLFLASPLKGAGLDGYQHAILQGTAQGTLEAQLAGCCADHAHSDVMQVMATRGLIGLLAWGFLLGLPAALFGRHLLDRNPEVAYTALAGLLVPVGYLVFGLTEATLDRSLFVTTYLVLIGATAATLFVELDLGDRRRRRVRVSATIITKDEAHNIEDCLRSVRAVADEIIVLDSGSTDDTVERARALADSVEVTDWPGFGIQKQRALDRATGDWVLSIDADERITEGLAREINERLADPDADAYKLPWAVTLYGTRLDFGRSGRSPLRLFRREGVRFSDALVHERILIPSGRKTRQLRGRMTHYTHRHFGQALEKSAKYAWLGSQEKFRRGKRTRTLAYASFRGLLTFIQVYFLRFGFLDGPVGYLVSVTYAQGSFNKYAGLWTLSRTERMAKRNRDQTPD
ncbi:O-antigen ligase family protein [Marinobacter fonticola]|uniref:O-antigen ligase family protein n=1 Tax=Marinobacter fonticola TaxID=2603215 RepID=UPI001D0D8EB1|nr:glycosyltransferase [Marinobacter fonticola]